MAASRMHELYQLPTTNLQLPKRTGVGTWELEVGSWKFDVDMLHLQREAMQSISTSELPGIPP
jgi:hypothetical protein